MGVQCNSFDLFVIAFFPFLAVAAIPLSIAYQMCVRIVFYTSFCRMKIVFIHVYLLQFRLHSVLCCAVLFALHYGGTQALSWVIKFQLYIYTNCPMFMNKNKTVCSFLDTPNRINNNSNNIEYTLPLNI